MIIPTEEEKALIEVIQSAREVQEFLWGKADEGFGWEEWKRMFRKRVSKLDEVDTTQPYAIIEIRKRLLQQAALSVAMLAYLQKMDRLPSPETPAPSALPTYAAAAGSEVKK